MRPSIYGGVMSGLGAQATTAAISLIDHNKPPTNRYPQQPPQVLSSRPPTYQSTQSASKKSGSLYQQPNTSSFNPLPSHQHKNSRTGDQYATGNFPTLQQHHHDSRDRPTEVHSVQTMRHTIQGTRSNSMSNLNQNINQRSNENLHQGGALVGEHHPHNSSSYATRPIVNTAE